MEGKYKSVYVASLRKAIEDKLADNEAERKRLEDRLETLKGMCAHDDVQRSLMAYGRSDVEVLICHVCGEDRRSKLKGCVVRP